MSRGYLMLLLLKAEVNEAEVARNRGYLMRLLL
jgi:hypothetical protein